MVCQISEKQFFQLSSSTAIGREGYRVYPEDLIFKTPRDAGAYLVEMLLDALDDIREPISYD